MEIYENSMVPQNEIWLLISFLAVNFGARFEKLFSRYRLQSQGLGLLWKPSRGADDVVVGGR